MSGDGDAARLRETYRDEVIRRLERLVEESLPGDLVEVAVDDLDEVLETLRDAVAAMVLGRDSTEEAREAWLAANLDVDEETPS